MSLIFFSHYSNGKINLLLIYQEFRQRGRFAGFSLDVSTDDSGLQNSSLCYKGGPELPPLNFTAVCIQSGRYVTFYNERFDGVRYPKGYQLHSVFTELCEVIVKGNFPFSFSSFYQSFCNYYVFNIFLSFFTRFSIVMSLNISLKDLYKTTNI